MSDLPLAQLGAVATDAGPAAAALLAALANRRRLTRLERRLEGLG